MSRSRRNGFTLVELLVVISIIGMLMALLLPAVGAATENARSLRCKNRLKQLATAMQSYESRFQRFPGYTNGVEVSGQPDRQLSWLVEIMADLERTDILDQWKSSSAGDPAAPFIDFLTCPSDPPLGEGPHTSYVANAGFADADLPGCGLLHSRYPVRMSNGQKVAHIDSSLDKLAAGDGATTTIMISENIQASFWPAPAFRQTEGGLKKGAPTNVFVWHNEANPGPDSPLRINGGTFPPGFDMENPGRGGAKFVAAAGRPSSEHNGGANVVFADGHVAFLKDGVDYAVYARLMSPDGKKCEKEYYRVESKATEINHTIPLADTDYR